jgi:hypothetical protein
VSDVVDLRPYAVVGAKPCCGTNLQSAKTSSTARNKNRHYSWETCDVKHFGEEISKCCVDFPGFSRKCSRAVSLQVEQRDKRVKSWIISQPLLSLNS